MRSRCFYLLVASLITETLLVSCSSPHSAARTMTNSLGMKFIKVPVENGELWVSVYETRVKDYEAFARKAGHPIVKPDFHQSPSHPVVNVNWNDAKAFCAWLSAKEHRRYRIPTDREWSALAGISARENPSTAPNKQPPIASTYPWGTGRHIGKGDGNYCDDAFGRKYGDGYQAEWLRGYNDGAAATAPVGRYRPDSHGLYDLGGNAWEWCEDWYDPPANTVRVVRGGAWRTGYDARMLSSFRGPDPQTLRIDSIGFRVVVDAE